MWLGIGTALADAASADLLPLLQTMYREWPFFKVTLDMVEARAACHLWLCDACVAQARL